MSQWVDHCLRQQHPMGASAHVPGQLPVNCLGKAAEHGPATHRENPNKAPAETGHQNFKVTTSGGSGGQRRWKETADFRAGPSVGPVKNNLASGFPAVHPVVFHSQTQPHHPRTHILAADQGLVCHLWFTPPPRRRSGEATFTQLV